MVTIDTGAEIDIVWEQQQARVRVPLDGEAGQDWCHRYGALARRQNLPAWAESHPGRAWVIVELPEGAGPDEIGATLDAARSLIAGAGSADDAPGAEETDGVIRAWWAHQHS